MIESRRHPPQSTVKRHADSDDPITTVLVSASHKMRHLGRPDYPICLSEKQKPRDRPARGRAAQPAL
jgi:hypothetical protein